MLMLLLTRDDIARAQEQLQATMETLFPELHPQDADFPFHHDGRYWYRTGITLPTTAPSPAI